MTACSRMASQLTTALQCPGGLTPHRSNFLITRSSCSPSSGCTGSACGVESGVGANISMGRQIGSAVPAIERPGQARPSQLEICGQAGGQRLAGRAGRQAGLPGDCPLNCTCSSGSRAARSARSGRLVRCSLPTACSRGSVLPCSRGIAGQGQGRTKVCTDVDERKVAADCSCQH